MTLFVLSLCIIIFICVCNACKKDIPGGELDSKETIKKSPEKKFSWSI